MLTGIKVAVVADSTHYALSISRVQMRPIDAAEAAAYWDSGRTGRQGRRLRGTGPGSCLHRAHEGSYSGIMGLPLFEPCNCSAGLANFPAVER